MRSRWCLGFVGVLLLCVGLAQAVEYSTEPAPAEAFQQIPEHLRSSLDPNGVRLVSTTKGKKTAIGDLWWRKQIPANDKPGTANDVVYGGLRDGEFVGVVSYLVPREDFQHHVLRPAMYSMRYANIKQDPSDETVSPYRDFVLLGPVFAEKNVNEVLPMDELEKRGRMISHKDEPAMLSLVPINPAYKKFPWAVSDDKGFCTLQIMAKQQQGKTIKDLPLGIILIRPPYENEGS